MEKRIIQFLKFCIVGLSNTGITYGIYYVLTYLGVSYLLSNTIGFFVGMINAFFWNSRFVFKLDSQKNKFISFAKMTLSYSVTSLLLSNLLLFVFIERLSISKYIAPIFVLFLTTPLNFIVNKYWSFSSKEGGVN